MCLLVSHLIYLNQELKAPPNTADQSSTTTTSISKQLITKEVSMANLSSSLHEDYHGIVSASVSVPFNWESQPGTPKSKFHQTLTLPPLTPPPSYFYTTNSTKRPKRKSKYSKSLLLPNIFPKLRSRKASTPSSPASSSSSSPSNSRSPSSSASSTAYYSVPSSPVNTPMTKHCAWGRTMSNPRVQLEIDSGMRCPHEYVCGSSASTTSGCYSYLLKVLLREFHQ